MKRVILGFAMLWAVMPLVRASDLTDALVEVDPRSRLKSGTGAAYGSVYGHQEEAPPTEELDATQAPSLGGRYHYDRSFDGLQSPLYDSDNDTTTPAPSDESRSTTVTPEPLGKPYARPGVWYQDDLDRSHR